MKTLARVLMVGVILSMLLLVYGASAQQTARPVDLKIQAGVPQTINYAGQVLRFASPIGLAVRLEPYNEINIKITIRPVADGSGGPQTVINEDPLHIYWENFGTDVYLAEPPSAVWTGIMYTESGFTEK